MRLKKRSVDAVLSCRVESRGSADCAVLLAQKKAATYLQPKRLSNKDARWMRAGYSSQKNTAAVCRSTLQWQCFGDDGCSSSRLARA